MYVERPWSIIRKRLLAVFEAFTSFKVPISPFGFLFSAPSIHVHVGGQLF